MSDSIKIVVCAKVGSDGARPVPGARISNCQKCLQSVWLSPSSLSRIERGYIVQCTDCCDLSNPEAFLENVWPEPEQLKEILGIWPYLYTPD